MKLVIDVAILYENYTTESILSFEHCTRKFPASTVILVLVFPYFHGIMVLDVACDAEGINAMHSNFKTIFCNVERSL